MFYTYVIENAAQEIYIGYTDDIKIRILRHNGLLPNKISSYTSKHKNGEWKIIYTEEHETRGEAIKREKQLKSYQGREFIKNHCQKSK